MIGSGVDLLGHRVGGGPRYRGRRTGDGREASREIDRLDVVGEGAEVIEIWRLGDRLRLDVRGGHVGDGRHLRRLGLERRCRWFGLERRLGRDGRHRRVCLVRCQRRLGLDRLLSDL